MESRYIARVAFRNESSKIMFDQFADALVYAIDHGPRYGNITVALGIHASHLVRQAIRTEKMYKLNGSTDAANAAMLPDAQAEGGQDGE